MKPTRIFAIPVLVTLLHFAPLPAVYGGEKPGLGVPPFLQVGQWYVALYTGEPQRPLSFKVLEDAGGGWIKVEHRDEVMWLNTNAALLIKPGTKN